MIISYNIQPRILFIQTFNYKEYKKSNFNHCATIIKVLVSFSIDILLSILNQYSMLNQYSIFRQVFADFVAFIPQSSRATGNTNAKRDQFSNENFLLIGEISGASLSSNAHPSRSSMRTNQTGSNSSASSSTASNSSESLYNQANWT